MAKTEEEIMKERQEEYFVFSEEDTKIILEESGLLELLEE
jgi:hypothetical protein